MQFILDDISFEPNDDLLLKRARVAADSPHAAELRDLADQARAIARPKALYRVGYIESKAEGSVTIDGVTLTSRVLRVNLEQAHRVFLYVATCGVEIQRWAESVADLLHRYWADAIQEMALRSASTALNADIAERHRPGKTSTMAPGSLGEWPLTEQRPLFALLGDVEGAIGVRLTESLLMQPTKSVSGIRFPTEESFESCQLCPRLSCPGRRAPYDQGLYEKKYQAEPS